MPLINKIAFLFVISYLGILCDLAIKGLQHRDGLDRTGQIHSKYFATAKTIIGAVTDLHILSATLY